MVGWHLCRYAPLHTPAPPEGSPDGEPIALPWSYTEEEVLGHHLELTHTNPPEREEP
jgi:hypothetical protein